MLFFDEAKRVVKSGGVLLVGPMRVNAAFYDAKDPEKLTVVNERLQRAIADTSAIACRSLLCVPSWIVSNGDEIDEYVKGCDDGSFLFLKAVKL